MELNSECDMARKRVEELRLQQTVGKPDSGNYLKQKRLMADCLLLHVSTDTQVIESNHDIVIKPLLFEHDPDDDWDWDTDPDDDLNRDHDGSDQKT